MKTAPLLEIENATYIIPIIAAVSLIILSITFLILRKKNKAMDPEKWQPFELVDVKDISHDVKRFRFALQSPQHILGLPIGQHIALKYIDAAGKDVQRSYTPSSSDDDIGYVDFVIKVYYANVHPKFPDGGKMSQHLASMKLGESILMKGPKGHLHYKGNGNFTIARGRDNMVSYRKKKIGMIAGGTGITPMLQVISSIQKNASDPTELWLIFANQTEDDIFLREELEAFQNENFHLHYTLDRPPEGWKYSSGFISADMCRAHLPPPGEDTMIFCCGPPPMIKFACIPAFEQIGFTENDWFSF